MLNNIYKHQIFHICNDVADKYNNVKFSNNFFNVKIAKFARTRIHAGFTFKYGVPVMNPSIWVCFRKLAKISARYTGMGDETSILNFPDIKSELIKFPNNKVGNTNIYRDFPAYAIDDKESLHRYTLLEEVPNLLEAMVNDGVSLLHKLYDFSSERNFLENMPPKYEPPPLNIPMPNYVGIPHTEFRTSAGVIMCLVRMSLGDFEFIDLYESDEFNPFTYKSRDRLQKLRNDMPEYKRRYEETGSIW